MVLKKSICSHKFIWKIPIPYWCFSIFYRYWIFSGGFGGLGVSTANSLKHKNSPGQRPKGVLDPVSACFYSVFFDKWASPGSLGDLSRLLAPYWPLTRPPLGKQESPPTTFRYDFRFVLPPRRRPRDLFARLSCRPSSAHVSGGLRGPFWEPFWPQKMFFLDIYVGPVGPHFGTDFQSFFATRALWNLIASGAAGKKAHMACDPQKPMEF